MNNGCICCTVRGDLIRIIDGLMRRKGKFDAIIVETTGLADPAPVAQTFFMDEQVGAKTKLDAVVTVADAKWLKDVSRTLKAAECEVRSASTAAAKLGNKRTDLVLVEAQPARPARAKALEALRAEAKGAQVPVIELPGEIAAERLARTLGQLAP
jgi:G3E family GTPase